MRANDEFGEFDELEEVKKLYEREMETQLGELGVRLQEWARRADSLNGNVEQGLNRLRHLQEAAVQKLHQMKYVELEEWSESRAVFDETWQNLQNAWAEFKNSRNQFGNRPAKSSSEKH